MAKSKVNLKQLRIDFEKICTDVMLTPRTESNRISIYNMVSDLFQKYDLQTIEFDIIYKGNAVKIIPNRVIDELAIVAIFKL